MTMSEEENNERQEIPGMNLDNKNSEKYKATVIVR